MHQIYSKIKQLVGIHFIQYILNRTDLIDIVDSKTIIFTDNQTLVLNSFNQAIKQVRLNLIQQDMPEDWYLKQISQHQQGELFRQFRQQCGGDIPSQSSGDELLNFLFSIASREFASLLMFNIQRYSIGYQFETSMKDMTDFITLIKKDKIDHICNDEEHFKYALSVVTDDDISHNVQVVGLLKSIIDSGFQNSTFRNEVSFDAFCEEIKKQVIFLRNLANGLETNYSSFVGIKGLVLDGFDTIELENFTVRKFGDNESPNLLVKNVIGNMSQDSKQVATGCVVEIDHITNATTELRDYSSSSSRKYYDYQHKHEDAFKHALIFTKLPTRGFKYSMHTNGICTSGGSGHSYSIDNRPNGNIILKSEDIEELTQWYDLLLKHDISHIQLSLRKISQAIFERKNLEDSYVDAMISLESLFGGKGEVNFKISTSVVRVLHKSPEDRKTAKTLMNKLYAMRSDILHGNIDISSDYQLLEAQTGQLISIVLRLLRIVLKNDKLLNMKADQRVNYVMYNDKL